MSRCDVCGGTGSADDCAPDALHECRDCGSAVHSFCHARDFLKGHLSFSLKDGEYVHKKDKKIRCEACRREAKYKSQGGPRVRRVCVICQCESLSGGLRHVSSSAGFGECFVHPICALAFPEVEKKMSKNKGVVFQKPQLAFGVKNRVCEVCDSRSGQMVQCEKCEASFHPTCAALSEKHQILDVYGVEKVSEFRCPRHSETSSESNEKFLLESEAASEAKALLKGSKRPRASKDSPRVSSKKTKRVGFPISERRGVSEQMTGEHCGVCSDGTWTPGNEILFCDGCDAAIHNKCLPGTPLESVPEGDWFCLWCAHHNFTEKTQERPVCLMCPNEGGCVVKAGDFVLKPPLREDHGEYVHQMCALWIPELHFQKSDGVDVVEGVNSVDDRRFGLTCVLCGTSGEGACIQCDQSNCYTPFHATCALKASLEFTFEKRSDGTYKGKVFCSEHGPSKRLLLTSVDLKLPHKRVPWPRRPDADDRPKKKPRGRPAGRTSRVTPGRVPEIGVSNDGKVLKVRRRPQKSSMIPLKQLAYAGTSGLKRFVRAPRTGFDFFCERRLKGTSPSADEDVWRRGVTKAKKVWIDEMTEAEREVYRKIADEDKKEIKTLIEAVSGMDKKDTSAHVRAIRRALDAALKSSEPAHTTWNSATTPLSLQARSVLGSCAPVAPFSSAQDVRRDAAHVWPLTESFFRRVTKTYASRLLKGAAGEPLYEEEPDPLLQDFDLSGGGPSWTSLVAATKAADGSVRKMARRVVRESMMDPTPRIDRGLGHISAYTGRSMDWARESELLECGANSVVEYARPKDLQKLVELSRDRADGRWSETAYVRALTTAHQRLILVRNSLEIEAMAHVTCLHFYSGLESSSKYEDKEEIPVPLAYVSFVKATNTQLALATCVAAMNAVPHGSEVVFVELMPHEADEMQKQLPEFQLHERRPGVTTLKVRTREGVRFSPSAAIKCALSGCTLESVATVADARESFAMEISTSPTFSTELPVDAPLDASASLRASYLVPTEDDVNGRVRMHYQDVSTSVLEAYSTNVGAIDPEPTDSRYADLAVLGVLPPSVRPDIPNQKERFEEAKVKAKQMEDFNEGVLKRYDALIESKGFGSEAEKEIHLNFKEFTPMDSQQAVLGRFAEHRVDSVEALSSAPKDYESLEIRLATLRKELKRVRKLNVELAESLLESVVSAPSDEFAPSTKHAAVERDFRMKLAKVIAKKKEENKKREMDNASNCQVCGGGESTQRDLIIICSTCERAFHQSCYNVDEIPEDDWFCKDCAAGGSRRVQAKSQGSKSRSPGRAISYVETESTKADLERATKVFRGMMGAPSASYFSIPNDDESYVDQVDDPTDLGTIGAKLSSRVYETFDGFRQDVLKLCSDEEAFGSSEERKRAAMALLKAFHDEQRKSGG